MLSHLTSAGLMLAALALYAVGADTGSAAFVIAGVIVEMGFWGWRRHNRPPSGQADPASPPKH